ncbi:tetratricopeptide repeat protein [Sphingomonas solaris]|uniref:Tetratricopeptide repeat protein n=1 Tax=Alterirhizorhabdus solaris TaxID=2529389 RepID=A0A558QZT5_9SPHN|nr:tetratricopeptide repeat protein [Sphingomonas solaris]TVV72635.1 tetratricopeptide repeat protein [Sphingomonas solaris]
MVKGRQLADDAGSRYGHAMPGPLATLIARPMLGQARRAARAGDWAGAADRYAALIARGLATPRDHVQRGHALKETGDLAGAEAAYRSATTAFPLDADALRQHGLFLRHHGDPEHAADVLARALALDPDDGAMRDDLAGTALAGAGLDERMIGALLGGADVPPALPGPLRRLRAWWHREAGHRHARSRQPWGAVRHYRAALAADPRQPAVLVALGDAAMADGDAIGAVHAYRLALFHRPRAPLVFAALGRALAAAGRRAAGLQAMLAAWRLSPGLPAAAAALTAAGWTAADLVRLTERSWGFLEPAAPDGLDRRERAIWAHLAFALAGE